MFLPLINTATTVTMSLNYEKKLIYSWPLYKDCYHNKPIDAQRAEQILRDTQGIISISNLVIQRNGIIFWKTVYDGGSTTLSRLTAAAIIKEASEGSIATIPTRIQKTLTSTNS